MVVNLSIVAEPKVRHAVRFQRLHAVRRVDDRQPMETERTILELRNVFDSKVVRTSMGHFQTADALPRHAFIRPEYCPDSTHFVFDLVFKKIIYQKLENEF